MQAVSLELDPSQGIHAHRQTECTHTVHTERMHTDKVHVQTRCTQSAHTHTECTDRQIDKVHVQTRCTQSAYTQAECILHILPHCDQLSFAMPTAFSRTTATSVIPC